MAIIDLFVCQKRLCSASRSAAQGVTALTDRSWYRRRTWSIDDQAAFFARLRRSRSGFHKAQYCRIQALELQQANNYKAALDLLDLLMTEWPIDAQKAAVYCQKAECLEKLGDHEGTITAYKLVFDTQRKGRSEITGAHLKYGLMVALAPYPGLYDEAISVLDEFSSSTLSFPIEDFMAAAVRAVITDARGNRELASRYAMTALAAAAKTHSGLARHATLGLVTEVPPHLERRLKQISELGN